VSFTELTSMLSPPKRSISTDDAMSKSVSNMTRTFGKAINKVAASVDGGASTTDNFPRVPIVMFKLVDLSKIYDEHSNTPSVGGGGGPTYAPKATNAQRPDLAQTHQPPTRKAASPRRQPTQAPAAAPPRRTAQAPPAREEQLMDFGTETTANPKNLHHANTAPASFGPTPTAATNETRAEKLKREYAKKKNTENRIWDDVDQRWVTVDPKQGAATNKSTASAPPGGNATASKSKLKGVSLDKVDVAGKSANVANAVQNRVNEMKSQQAKALNEIREREAAKAVAEDEEDVVRKQLEPKIKAWSEEHGKKKQLRALLASLHTVLWPEAKWKPIGLGDLLDDRKVRIAFMKASRVVHPDKTLRLPPDQRFLAKRIFDALSQANIK